MIFRNKKYWHCWGIYPHTNYPRYELSAYELSAIRIIRIRIEIPQQVHSTRLLIVLVEFCRNV